MVNDTQQRNAAFDGLSYIAVLLIRLMVVEKFYLKDECGANTALATQTIKLYRAILEFQARAICQFDRGTAHQLARNFVEADGWTRKIAEIKVCDEACEKFRVLLDTKERQQGMKRLENRLRDIEIEVQQSFDTLLAEFKSSHEDQKRWNLSQTESECFCVLRTSDYESDKSRIADRVPGTCEWFLSHHKYQSWLSESHSRMLWVTADPGCGKSVLSKYLVDIYPENATAGGISVCYFFFRDGSEKNQDGTNALCALLHQLFTQKRALLRHALPDFEHNGSKLSGLFETLWSIWVKAVTDEQAGSIVGILDALDECGGTTRSSLIRHLTRFLSERPADAKVKLILTSRPNTTIGNDFMGECSSVASIKLMGEGEIEMAVIEKEISLVINKKIENFRDKRRQWGIHDDTHQTISGKIARIENRTYLWVALIFPELDRYVKSHQSALLQAIKSIPSTLEEAYERILSCSRDKARAKRLLYFVLAAQQPLTLEEMNIAMATTDTCTSVDDLELEPEASFQDTARELCGLFISVSDSKIYLIHQTAREFLLAPRSGSQPVSNSTNTWMCSMDLSTSHLELAKTCLLYLHLSGLEDLSSALVVNKSSKELRILPNTVQKQGFLKYSATNWCLHVKESDCEVGNSLTSMMLSITTRGSPAFNLWLTLPSVCQWSSDPLIAKGVPSLDQLSLAACFGLRPVIETLLKVGSPEDHKSAVHRAAFWAIRRLPNLFHLFWDEGIDVGTQFEQRLTLMHEAAACGRVEVVKCLIGAGFSVNSEDIDSREPLFFAVSNEFEEIVSLMVKEGARVNHKDEDGVTVLFEAVWTRSVRMTEKLLKLGADHNVKDSRGQTPLSTAAGYRDEPIARLLIKYGAEVDSSDYEGQTPLSHAIGVRDWDTSTLLISHGAQIDRKDCEGRTPLSHAAQDFTESSLEFLRQKGFQVDMRCSAMRTPLSYAAQWGLASNISHLIENGALVNSSDWQCNTPLILAAKVVPYFSGLNYQIEQGVEVLLNQGADPTAVNEDGCSPLSFLNATEAHRSCHRTREDGEAIKNKVRDLLRRHGAGEVNHPTSANTLTLVVAQLTAKLIEIVENFMDKETSEYPIAVKSSVHLFRQMKLHPTVSSLTIQDKIPIEQGMTGFVLGQTRQDGSVFGLPGPADRPPLERTNPDLLKREEPQTSNEYGGLPSSQTSKHCSLFLHRLARLQQRLFNVNRCLYYLDSNPEDCPKTINELITKVTGQESLKFHEIDRNGDSSSREDNVET